MSEPVKGPEHPRRYEDSDVSVKQLFAFAAGVVGLVLVGVLASAFVFHVMVHHTPMGPPASPFEDVRDLPPNWRLQTAAPLDLQHYRADQDKILSEYGWVDPHEGIVRIPLERAMDLLLQKGYPVRANSPAEGNPGRTTKSAVPSANRQVAPPPVGAKGTQ
jgi:hypothetical protein